MYMEYKGIEELVKIAAASSYSLLVYSYTHIQFQRMKLMGQVISNTFSSYPTSNEYGDDVDVRSSRSGKHDHEEIQSISSTTTLSSSSSALLHPFAILLTTTATDDDHTNNQNSGDGAFHGNHVTTASFVKRLVTISDYNFVEKNSSKTENDHDEAALVLELSAHYRQEEGILVVEKVLDNQDDEHHHHNNNQVNGGGAAEEVEDFLEEKHEEMSTAQSSVSSITTTTTSTVSHLSSSSLLPVAVLLTSTNDHHNNITQNGISTDDDDDEATHDSHHGSGGAKLLMVSQFQSQSQKEEIVTENVLDDDHQNSPDNGVGVAKEVESDDIVEKFTVIKTCNEQIIKERVIKHYSNRHKILLVGEGDFSFSACLARYFRSGINMVATSFDYKDMLLEKHWSAEEHVEELKRLGCKVLHGVDVHIMDSHRRLKRMRFDRIIYNFPHAGHFPSYCEFDLVEMHQELLLGFFKSASKMLVDEGGEVHVSHRDDPPYDEWEIVKLAKKAGLALKERVEFEKKDYPGYHNKRGGGIQSNKTFPLGYSSFTFKFIISSPPRRTSTSTK